MASVQGDGVRSDVWPPSGIGMTVDARDDGGGVLRVGVEVDGAEPQWHAAAEAPCRIWPGSTRAFVSPQPCPTAVAVPLTIRTDELGEGLHAIRILVEDAAGNRTTAYGPVTKRISAAAGPGGNAVAPADTGGDGGASGAATGASDPAGTGGNALGGIPTLPPIVDPGPSNGTPATSAVRLAAQWDGTSSTVRSVRYGARPVIRGQLTTTDGAPVRGAAIRVGVTADQRGARRVEQPTLRTDDRGSFRWRLPKGIGSRRIALAYHRHVADATPAASRTLRLEVAAGVQLRLDRTRARQGQTVRLRGQLVGRPLPRVGSVVELQARNPGRKWLTFRTVRANRAGRFVAGYRFRMPGPATFEMRARVRKSGDYPYATGVSPHRRITVR